MSRPLLDDAILLAQHHTSEGHEARALSKYAELEVAKNAELSTVEDLRHRAETLRAKVEEEYGITDASAPMSDNEISDREAGYDRLVCVIHR